MPVGEGQEETRPEINHGVVQNTCSTIRGDCASPALKDQGEKPEDEQTQGNLKHGSTHGATSLQQEVARQHASCGQVHPSVHSNALPLQDSQPSDGRRDAKRRADTLDSNTECPAKRHQPSSKLSPVEPTADMATAASGSTLDPTGFWAREGHWPPEYFEPGVECLPAERNPQCAPGPEHSAASTSIADDGTDDETYDETDDETDDETYDETYDETDDETYDETPIEETTYEDQRYETLLAKAGSFMHESEHGLSTDRKDEYFTLIFSAQQVPTNTLFEDDIFQQTCQRVRRMSEDRLMTYLTPLIVPSMHNLRPIGTDRFDILVQSVREPWDNSFQVTGICPKPDYSVGFDHSAFTEAQHQKMASFVGDYKAGDQSLFMGTSKMYFPFLTCEVKSGAASLDVADRQNAHSMTIAVRAITQLYRWALLEEEIDRQIVCFSISHNHRYIRIYGHYPVIDGERTEYYRHEICKCDFTTLDGRHRWLSSRFVLNLYMLWAPRHYERICLALDHMKSEADIKETAASHINKAPASGIDNAPALGINHAPALGINNAPASASDFSWSPESHSMQDWEADSSTNDATASEGGLSWSPESHSVQDWEADSSTNDATVSESGLSWSPESHSVPDSEADTVLLPEQAAGHLPW